MSAAELRQAAETLRERVKAATDGPWNVGASGFMARVVYGPEESLFGEAGKAEDATYIAIMHPGVGLALANWLDIIASKEKAREGIDSPIPVLYLPEALTIARAINGGPS
jgi:hypothetical protein